MSPRPPIARWHVEIAVDSNTVDEFVRQLRSIANDAEYEDRIPIDTASSDRYRAVGVEREPTMTPERYDAELMAWADARRCAQRKLDEAKGS